MAQDSRTITSSIRIGASESICEVTSDGELLFADQRRAIAKRRAGARRLCARSCGLAVLLDEFSVTGHPGDALLQTGAQTRGLRLQVRERQGICERIPMLGLHALPEHDRYPTGIGKELTIVTSHLAPGAEQLDAMRERVGHRGFTAGTPERLLPLVQHVVQDDEVANLLVLRNTQAIEFGLRCGVGLR